MGLSSGWSIALLKRRWWIQQSSNTTDIWECRSKWQNTAQWRPNPVTSISKEQDTDPWSKMQEQENEQQWDWNGSLVQIQQRAPERQISWEHNKLRDFTMDVQVKRRECRSDFGSCDKQLIYPMLMQLSSQIVEGDGSNFFSVTVV